MPLVAGVVPQAVKAAPSSEHSNALPATVEKPKVGDRSLTRPLGPPVSAVSTTLCVIDAAVPTLPDWSVPRTANVWSPSVAKVRATPELHGTVADPSTLHCEPERHSFADQVKVAPLSVTVDVVADKPEIVGPTKSSKTARTFAPTFPKSGAVTAHWLPLGAGHPTQPANLQWPPGVALGLATRTEGDWAAERPGIEVPGRAADSHGIALLKGETGVGVA